MHPTSSDWFACLGMCPVYIIPSARVSSMPRGKLEKPLLKQQLLFISDQHSKFSASFTLLETQPREHLYFIYHPLQRLLWTHFQVQNYVCDVSQSVELTYKPQSFRD